MFNHRKIYATPLLAVVSAVLAAAGHLPYVMILLVPAFALLLHSYQHYLQKNIPLAFIACWVMAVVVGLFIGIYRPAGFSYPLVLHVDRLYKGGLPLDLYINIAKAIAGYTILFFLFSTYRNNAYIRSIPKQIALIVMFALLVLVTAYFLLGLGLHIKNVEYILIFGATNLLVTCVAEEAFMRLLLQEQLCNFICRLTKNTFWQNAIPLLITTLLFVLTHAIHGVEVITVFAIAGFLYGLIYTLTKNIIASMAVHFLVNIVHFSFLTYPIA